MFCIALLTEENSFAHRESLLPHPYFHTFQVPIPVLVPVPVLSQF